MVAEKGKPTFGWLGISKRSLHPAGDRSFRDSETKHQKLAMNARRAPGRILANHLEDQLLHFLGDCLLPLAFLTLEISFQYDRKPARCQRTTVSGVTMMRDCFQPDQTRRANIQKP
jgi:hypothetical protein